MLPIHKGNSKNKTKNKTFIKKELEVIFDTKHFRIHSFVIVCLFHEVLKILLYCYFTSVVIGRNWALVCLKSLPGWNDHFQWATPRKDGKYWLFRVTTYSASNISFLNKQMYNSTLTGGGINGDKEWRIEERKKERRRKGKEFQ